MNTVLKKALTIATASAAVLAMGACGSSGSSSSKGGDKQKTIGFVAVGPEGGFRTANENDLKKAFKNAGFNMIYSPTQNNDQQKQIQAFNKFVNDEVDAIVLSSTEDSGWDESLKKAKEAEIPVFLVDRNVQTKDESLVASHIGPSNEWAGPSRIRPLAPSGKFSLTNSAACCPAHSLEGPMWEATRLSSLVCTLRSTKKTGISASLAFFRDSSQPLSSVEDRTIASTSSLTNLLKAWICFC